MKKILSTAIILGGSVGMLTAQETVSTEKTKTQAKAEAKNSEQTIKASAEFKTKSEDSESMRKEEATVKTAESTTPVQTKPALKPNETVRKNPAKKLEAL